MAPLIDYLAICHEIDSDRISGVRGASAMAATTALRAAAFDERLKCVAFASGAFYNAEDYLGRFSGGGADKVVHGLFDLDDHMMKVMGAHEVEAAYRLFAKRNLDGVPRQVARTAGLVLHGENDRPGLALARRKDRRRSGKQPASRVQGVQLVGRQRQHRGIEQCRHARQLPV